MAEPTKKRIGVAAPQATTTNVEVLGREFAPHKDVYHLVLRSSWWAFFAAMALMFFGTNALFAAVYNLSPGCIEHVTSYEDAFYFSIQTLGTIGYGGMSPATRYGHLVVSVEAFAGLSRVSRLPSLRAPRPASCSRGTPSSTRAMACRT
jgi:inward rectifier potassium channel